MSFRTIGWFGPQCPRLPNVFETNAGMVMYDYEKSERVKEFPLDLAMQIFWGAQTITANFAIDYTISGISYSESRQIVVQWGEIAFASGSVLDRAPVTTASAMLCNVQNPQSQIHTFKETINSGGGNGDIQTFFGINRRPTLGLKKLHAPFSAQIAFEGSVAALSTSNTQGGIIAGTCQWNTPWGNAQTPLRRFGAATGGSMTITVTAADPATRYGGL
jgi:hypothetical protein